MHRKRQRTNQLHQNTTVGLAMLCVMWLTMEVPLAQAFFSSFSSKGNNKPNTDSSGESSVTQAPLDRGTIRIRQTVESDLNAVSAMLSTASTKPKPKSPFDWKNKMDQLFTQADIAVLLRCRLEAVEEGKKALARLESIPNLREEDRLKLLWATSDKLRNLIEKASGDTGEDNLWRRHNFALTPADFSWLNHLQMTAEHVETNQVVGFCEVAMLSNPLLMENHNTNDDKDSVNANVAFSPAITNLATSPEWRRRGIASRMLKVAERVVQRKWNYNELGLFVEKNNDAALALYERMGYETSVTCDGGDRLGELWYMVRRMEDAEQKTKEMEESEIVMRR